MTGQQLKNSILQLAIQGKLVPQNPADEPASELLQRIRKEKEKLVKEKKIKKEKPLPEISEDEKPFDIPEGWVWCRLNDIVSVLGDGLHGTPEYCEHGEYFFINGNNLSNCSIIIKDGTKRVSVSEYEKYKKELNVNTILVSINGTIGNIGYYNNEPVILGKSACYFNLLSKKLKPYITTVLRTQYFFDYATDNATGSTIKNVSLKTMNNFCLPLPPLQEQHRIVEKIEELMPLVDEYDKAQKELNTLNANLPEALKKSILQEAIQGKLGTNNPDDESASELLKRIRAEKEKLVKEKKIKKEKPLPEISEDEKPFDIPESWVWCRLKDVSDILYGYPFDSSLFNEVSGTPLIRIRNVLSGCTNLYTTEIVEKKYLIKAGDMLVGMDGNFNVAYWNSEPAYLNQRVCCIKSKMDVCLQQYLFYYLPIVLEEICKTAHYVTVKHLSDRHLSQIVVPLPPLQEQHRIVEKLNELLPKLETLK